MGLGPRLSWRCGFRNMGKRRSLVCLTDTRSGLVRHWGRRMMEKADKARACQTCLPTRIIFSSCVKTSFFSDRRTDRVLTLANGPSCVGAGFLDGNQSLQCRKRTDDSLCQIPDSVREGCSRVQKCSGPVEYTTYQEVNVTGLVQLPRLGR